MTCKLSLCRDWGFPKIRGTSIQGLGDGGFPKTDYSMLGFVLGKTTELAASSEGLDAS